MQIIKACKAPGPLALSALSSEELALLEAMMNRLDRCAKAAFEVRSSARFALYADLCAGVRERAERMRCLPACTSLFTQIHLNGSVVCTGQQSLATGLVNMNVNRPLSRSPRAGVLQLCKWCLLSVQVLRRLQEGIQNINIQAILNGPCAQANAQLMVDATAASSNQLILLTH